MPVRMGGAIPRPHVASDWVPGVSWASVVDPVRSPAKPKGQLGLCGITLVDECWFCDEPNLVWWVPLATAVCRCGTAPRAGLFPTGLFEPDFRIEECEPVEVEAHRIASRLGIEPAVIESRFSKQAGQEYRGFTCHSCNALFGDAFLHQKFQFVLVADQLPHSLDLPQLTELGAWEWMPPVIDPHMVVEVPRHRCRRSRAPGSNTSA